MFDEDENNYTRVRFLFTEVSNGVTSTVERTLSNKHTYAELVEEFRWFLQNIGYTYIAGLTVLSENGKELYTTDI